MLAIQKFVCEWNDGTIIACSPIVVGEMMEPNRIVLRDLGNTLVVHTQVWPVSQLEYRIVTPFYIEGHYFTKTEVGASARAWNKFDARYRLLVGEDLMPDPVNNQSAKAKLRTEITTLTSADECNPQ